jgi:hypothetical protein
MHYTMTMHGMHIFSNEMHVSRQLRVSPVNISPGLLWNYRHAVRVPSMHLPYRSISAGGGGRMLTECLPGSVQTLHAFDFTVHLGIKFQ